MLAPHQTGRRGSRIRGSTSTASLPQRRPRSIAESVGKSPEYGCGSKSGARGMRRNDRGSERTRVERTGELGHVSQVGLSLQMEVSSRHQVRPEGEHADAGTDHLQGCRRGTLQGSNREMRKHHSAKSGFGPRARTAFALRDFTPLGLPATSLRPAVIRSVLPTPVVALQPVTFFGLTPSDRPIGVRYPSLMDVWFEQGSGRNR